MRTLVTTALVCVLLAACTSQDSSAGGDCTSSYDPVARAATFPALRQAMLDHDDGRSRPVSTRVQARGHDLGSGDEDAVRIVDLLDGRGRRLLQVEVWRTVDGGWAAGAWQQCID
jgi:hypothetical protein